MESIWDSVRLSKDGQAAPEETLARLGRCVAEMRKVTCLPGVNPKQVPYLMSWLSSHQWQRATNKAHFYDAGAFTLAQPGDADGEDDDCTKEEVFPYDSRDTHFQLTLFNTDEGMTPRSSIFAYPVPAKEEARSKDTRSPQGPALQLGVEGNNYL
jgi:hypothetical protein